MINVASFTDAWIETNNPYSVDESSQSHLLQMRGLKQLTKAQAEYTSESHLLQMRGLKHSRSNGINKPKVASFTDAWIET